MAVKKTTTEKTRTHFAYRIDIWSKPKAEILIQHVAGVEDYDVAVAAFHAACKRWPYTPVTLRQGTRVIEDSRRLRIVSSDQGRQGGR